MKKKGLLKSTVILASANFIARLMGYFFRIPLVLLIGEEGLGLYQLTYPLYNFLLSLSSGIPASISRMISERAALGRRNEIRQIFSAALKVMLYFGLSSSLLIIIFSKKIISILNWSPTSYYSLLGISLAPLFTCLLSAFRGYFQGLQEMTYPALSVIIEQFVRVFAGVYLAYLLIPGGIHLSAGGASFGSTAGAIAALLILIVFYSKEKKPFRINEKNPYILKELIKTAVPVSLAQSASSITSLIDSIIVPSLLISSGLNYQMASILYGQLTGKAMVLVNVPLAISYALSLSVIPALSEAAALKNNRLIKSNINMAFKLSMLIALPSSCGLFIFSRQILGVVFAGMDEGWQLLRILSVAAIFIIFSQTTAAILNGIGRTILPLVSIFIGGIFKIFFCITFIPKSGYGIRAAALSTLLSYLIISIINLTFVMIITKIPLNIIEFLIKPLICTCFMALGVVLIYSYVYNQFCKNSLALISAISVGIVIYGLFIVFTGTIGLKDIKGYLKG